MPIPSESFAKSRSTRLGEVGSAFWSGFTTPSLFALVVMVVAFVATALGVFVGVTPTQLAGPLAPYLARGSTDAEGFATSEAYKLAYGPKTVGGPPRLYIIGNSLIAQALASDERMTADMHRATRRDWDVRFLISPLQGALDEAALADYATRQTPGIVMLSSGFDRLGSDTAELLKYYRMARLGFRSEWPDEQVRSILNARPRRTTGNFLFDNRFFFIRNASMISLRYATRQPAEYRIDSYVFKQTDIKLSTYSTEILNNLKANYRPGKIAVDLLTDTATRLKARGNRIVLFEAPISPALLANPVDRERYEIHLQEMARLSANLGAYYCRLPDGVAVPPSIFRDYYHIADPAWQARLRARLAECVADVTRGETRS